MVIRRFLPMLFFSMTLSAPSIPTHAQADGLLTAAELDCLAHALVGTRLAEQAEGLPEYTAEDLRNATQRDRSNEGAVIAGFHLTNVFAANGRKKFERQAAFVNAEAGALGCDTDWDATAIELRKRLVEIKARLK